MVVLFLVFRTLFCVIGWHPHSFLFMKLLDYEKICCKLLCCSEWTILLFLKRISKPFYLVYCEQLFILDCEQMHSKLHVPFLLFTSGTAINSKLTKNHMILCLIQSMPNHFKKLVFSYLFFLWIEACNHWVVMPDIFQEAGLPLWLRPYEVLVTSSYTALIETIPDTVILWLMFLSGLGF